MLPVLATLLAACGTTPVRPVASHSATFPPTSTATPSSSPTASPSPSPTACTPLRTVDAWSVARRAAQLVVVPALDGRLDPLDATFATGVGGVLLFGTPTGPLPQQVARADAAAGVPLLVMTDEEGGGVQRLAGLVDPLPWPRQMAQTMTPAAVQAAAAHVGAQMRALGVNVDLAPVLDLDDGATLSATDPDGPRSFGLDPQVATSYGLAFATGLRQAGVVPVVKHFPGLGGVAANTDIGAASTLPLATLQRAGLLPFEAAVNAGYPAVMVSHASVPGLTDAPASLSSAAVTGLLRGQLGFHGLVITDSLTAGAVAQAGYSLPTAAVAALRAGDDMVMFGSTLTPAEVARLAPGYVAQSLQSIVTAVSAAVAQGTLSTARLDDAVLHVLAAKHIDPCAPA